MNLAHGFASDLSKNRVEFPSGGNLQKSAHEFLDGQIVAVFIRRLNGDTVATSPRERRQVQEIDAEAIVEPSINRPRFDRLSEVQRRQKQAG